MHVKIHHGANQTASASRDRSNRTWRKVLKASKFAKVSRASSLPMEIEPVLLVSAGYPENSCIVLFPKLPGGNIFFGPVAAARQNSQRNGVSGGLTNESLPALNAKLPTKLQYSQFYKTDSPELQHSQFCKTDSPKLKYSQFYETISPKLQYSQCCATDSPQRTVASRIFASPDWSDSDQWPAAAPTGCST